MGAENTEDYAIYMAGHPAFVNHSVIHRLTINKKKKAVLVYGKIGDLSQKVNKYVDLKIFDKVVYAFDTMGQLEKTEEDCITKITNYYDRIFKDNEIDISQSTPVYVGVDTLNSYGIYLIMNKIPFNYFEGGLRNFFHNTLVRMNSVDPKIASDEYKLIMKKLGISDVSNPLITCLVNPESNYSNLSIKTSIFSTVENISKLTKTQKKTILKFYDNIEINEGKYNLIVMSSQWGLRHLQQDIQKNVLTYIYQIICQYCIKDELPILIKPHPLCNVDESFLQTHFDAPIIPKIFPSEYMGLLNNVSIEHTYTVGSAGTYGKDSYKTGFFIYQWYEYIEIICFLLDELYSNGKNVICSMGISTEALSFCTESLYPGYFKIITNPVNNSTIFYYYTTESFNQLIESIKRTPEQSITIIIFNIGPIKQFIKDVKELKNTTVLNIDRKQINTRYVPINSIKRIFVCNTNDDFLVNIHKEFELNKIGIKTRIDSISLDKSYPREYAQLLRDDIEFGIDINKAIEYMTLAANQNAKWSKTELADMLLKRSSTMDLQNRINMLEQASKEGDGLASFKLACSYLEGIGVNKNYDLAIKYLLITEKNESIELLDNFFNGNKKTIGQCSLFEIATSLYERKSTYIVPYLSNCYKCGYGTKKNLLKAIEILGTQKKSDESTLMNYVDLLLTSCDYHHHNEAYAICSNLSEQSTEANIRLGLMYYEGKAVNRDYLKAKYYFEKCNKDSRVENLLHSINSTLLKIDDED